MLEGNDEARADEGSQARTWQAVSAGLEFSRDWANLPHWNDLVASLPDWDGERFRVLEIGAFEGLTTCYLLHSIGARGWPVAMTCIDTWLGSREHAPDHRHHVDFSNIEERFDRNLERLLPRLDLTHSLRKIRSTSLAALSELVISGERFDLIFVDGSHEAQDVLMDAALAVELAEIGGTIVFDDYNWLRVKGDPTLGSFFTAPRVAIDAVVNINRNRLKIAGPASLSRLTLRRTTA